MRIFLTNWSSLTNDAVGLAYTAKQIDPEPAAGGAFAFQKMFGDDDFIASGIITFPVGGKKAMKSTKDNTYVSFQHGMRLWKGNNLSLGVFCPRWSCGRDHTQRRVDPDYWRHVHCPSR